MDWVPKTKLGKLVQSGQIKTMAEAFDTRLPIREAEIVDILIPPKATKTDGAPPRRGGRDSFAPKPGKDGDMEDAVLDVNMVQRMTDSGRRVKFAVTCAVGNLDGYVGIGRASGKEVGPTIRRAIDNAKLHLIQIKRGCGSWECGCGEPHTFPYKVVGKAGSVRVTFEPAPKGTGLAVGDVSKQLLRLAGIEDAWGRTAGHTKTTVNYSLAVFDALHQVSMMKVMPGQTDRLKIVTGACGRKVAAKAVKEEDEDIARLIKEVDSSGGEAK